MGTVKTHGILASELPRRSPERPPALPAPPKRSQTPPGARERRSRADRARAGAGDDDDCEDDREDARGPRASATAARPLVRDVLYSRSRWAVGPPTYARPLPPPPTCARTRAYRHRAPPQPPHPPTHHRHHATLRHTTSHARARTRTPPPPPRTHAPTTKPPWCHTTSHHITCARTHMPPPPRTHARTHTHARIHARAAATTTTPPPPREHSTPLSCETRPLSESQVRNDTRPRIEKKQRHCKGWEGGVGRQL